LKKSDKHVLVIGGGIAGLSVALDLARLNIAVELVEKTSFFGGHAIQMSCKATESCVRCGVCMVEETLRNVLQNPKIKVLPDTRVEEIMRSDRYTVKLNQKPIYIDPKKCTGCGMCFDRCPGDGAIVQGQTIPPVAGYKGPHYVIRKDRCLYFKDRACALCREVCPEKAIELDREGLKFSREIDAIIVATGFQPFNPEDKPYGYKKFENVITSLDLERMLRYEGNVKRPSDDKAPKSIAFIQCVGSRDAKLNHLWCSKVCCASALRMARLMRAKQPETLITFFYIDVQTFGKDFHEFYENVQKEVRMIRAIPGDIFRTVDDRLKVTFFDSQRHESLEEVFDLVVLSTGILPGNDTRGLAKMLHVELADSGFIGAFDQTATASMKGIFAAGTAVGPMSIAETIASAGNTAWQAARYLEQQF